MVRNFNSAYQTNDVDQADRKTPPLMNFREPPDRTGSSIIESEDLRESGPQFLISGSKCISALRVAFQTYYFPTSLFGCQTNQRCPSWNRKLLTAPLSRRLYHKWRHSMPGGMRIIEKPLEKFCCPAYQRLAGQCEERFPNNDYLYHPLHQSNGIGRETPLYVKHL